MMSYSSYLSSKFYTVSDRSFTNKDAPIITSISAFDMYIIDASVIGWLGHRLKSPKILETLYQLDRQGIRQVGDLAQTSEKQLCEEFKINAKHIPFIESKLRQCNLSLGMYFGDVQTSRYRNSPSKRGWQY